MSDFSGDVFDRYDWAFDRGSASDILPRWETKQTDVAPPAHWKLRGHVARFFAEPRQIFPGRYTVMENEVHGSFEVGH